MAEVPPWFINEWANTAFRVDGIYNPRVKRGEGTHAGPRDFWTFYAVTEGVLRLRQGAWTADLAAGDQTILTPDSPFTREVLSEVCRVAIIDFRIEATGLGSDPLPALGLPAKVHIPPSSRWLRLLREGLAAFASGAGSISGMLEGRGAVDQIIGQYLRKGIEESAIAASRHAYVPPWLNMIRQRIAGSFWIHDADLASMAREAGYSRSYLNRVFKQAFGSTPTEFLWEQRLQIAARKLDTDPSLAIGGIASNCGFKSHTHFSRMFHRRFGMTPLAWRRRRLEDAGPTRSEASSPNRPPTPTASG